MPSIDVLPAPGAAEDLESVEPQAPSAPVIGIIYPPPEVRSILFQEEFLLINTVVNITYNSQVYVYECLSITLQTDVQTDNGGFVIGFWGMNP